MRASGLLDLEPRSLAALEAGYAELDTVSVEGVSREALAALAPSLLVRAQVELAEQEGFELVGEDKLSELQQQLALPAGDGRPFGSLQALLDSLATVSQAHPHLLPLLNAQPLEGNGAFQVL